MSAPASDSGGGDGLEAFEIRGEPVVLAGTEMVLRPATLRQLPALRRLGAAAAAALAAADLGAAVADRAAEMSGDIATLTGTGPELWQDAAWGETVLAAIAILRVNRAYVSGPFAARIATLGAAIRQEAGAAR